jgi:transaldolase
LDDIGEEGFDIVKNISKMYREWSSHVMVLGASIRNLDHLFHCFKEIIDITTVPLSILTAWKEHGLEKDPKEFVFALPEKKSIPFENIPQQDWSLYDVRHELTDKGIEKFSSDWKNLFQ